MKVITFFLAIYIIIMGLIFSFYININNEQEKQVSIVKNKTKGIKYLKLINKLTNY